MCKPSDQASLSFNQFAALCRDRGWQEDRIRTAWAFVLRKAVEATAPR